MSTYCAALADRFTWMVKHVAKLPPTFKEVKKFHVNSLA